MPKTFTRVYCKDSVLNLAGHIDTPKLIDLILEGKSAVKDAIFEELKIKLEATVDIEYLGYLDYDDSNDEPANQKDLEAFNKGFDYLVEQGYIADYGTKVYFVKTSISYTMFEVDRDKKAELTDDEIYVETID